METRTPDDYMRFVEGLGANISRLRKAKGLSQEELCELIGISRVHMGYIEQARRTPSLEILYDIARALGVGVGELFPAR